MTTADIRVCIAFLPDGLLDAGNTLTTLCVWLAARRAGGKFSPYRQWEWKELIHSRRITPTGSHSGWKPGKMNSLIEDGTALGIGVPSVRARLAAFCGVLR